MLRQKFHGIDDLWIGALEVFYISHFVAELIQRLTDNPECIALVVTLEVLHVFEEKRCRTLGRDYSGNIEEKRTLSLALKPMLAT